MRAEQDILALFCGAKPGGGGAEAAAAGSAAEVFSLDEATSPESIIRVQFLAHLTRLTEADPTTTTTTTTLGP